MATSSPVVPGPVVEVVRSTVLPPSPVSGLLTSDELARIALLRRPDDRARATTARALLRAAVGQRTGLPADAVTFDYRCAACGGAHGKPLVEWAHGAAAVHASVSYSGSEVLVAVAAVPVGVDVERCSRTDFAGFGEQALTTAERADVGRLDPRLRPAARAALWTRKEAILKISGLGLSVSPAELAVGCGATGPVRVPSHVVSGGMACLRELEVGPAYRASVAVAGRAMPTLAPVDARTLLAAAATAARTATA